MSECCQVANKTDYGQASQAGAPTYPKSSQFLKTCKLGALFQFYATATGTIEMDQRKEKRNGAIWVKYYLEAITELAYDQFRSRLVSTK